MNVKLPFQFIFSDTAVLAGIVVTAASIATLLSPIGAVVGFGTTLPIEIILTCNDAALRLPFGITFLRAKASSGGVGLFNAKLFVTLRTFQYNAILQIRALASESWSRDTFLSAGKIPTKTFPRAEADSTVLLAGDFLTALLTKYRGQFNDTKILYGINRCAAFMGTILSRPTAMIPKFFTALWAGCPSATRL